VDSSPALWTAPIRWEVVLRFTPKELKNREGRPGRPVRAPYSCEIAYQHLDMRSLGTRGMKSLRVAARRCALRCRALLALPCHHKAAEHEATRMRGISSPEWEDVVQSSDASIQAFRENLDSVEVAMARERGKVWLPGWELGDGARRASIGPFRPSINHASTQSSIFFFILSPTPLEARTPG